MNFENDGRQNRIVTQKQLFVDVFKTAVFKNLVIFTRKQLCWSLF